MFKDRTKIKFIAGKGGNGKNSLGPNKIPNGGRGGTGGSIYLEGSESIYDLGVFRPDIKYRAENGKDGGIKNLTGSTGADLIVKVPLVTCVYDLENNLILEITRHGERKLLAKGGIGGIGNTLFRKGQLTDPAILVKGQPGQEVEAVLELELVSDIVFIGYPNAGKSSLLNSLTNAKSKVGAYAFTTTVPHLGRMGKYILMDLPGLIQGSAQGRGLGTHFVKHTRRTRIIAHVISLENPDPLAAYAEMHQEIIDADPNLSQKPQIVILTKTDVISPEQLQKVQSQFKQAKYTALSVCILDDTSVSKLSADLGEILSRQD